MLSARKHVRTCYNWSCFTSDWNKKIGAWFLSRPWSVVDAKPITFRQPNENHSKLARLICFSLFEPLVCVRRFKQLVYNIKFFINRSAYSIIIGTVGSNLVENIRFFRKDIRWLHRDYKTADCRRRGRSEANRFESAEFGESAKSNWIWIAAACTVLSRGRKLLKGSFSYHFPGASQGSHVYLFSVWALTYFIPPWVKTSFIQSAVFIPCTMLVVIIYT